MKKHIFLIIGLVVAGMLVTAPMVLAADSGNYGLNDTASAAGLSQQGDVATIIGNIIGTGLSLISVLFFIMMIYGGIMWMTARGKDEVSKKALDVIFSAIIGIIIVLSAYAITTFVFKSVGAGGSSSNSGGSGGTPTQLTCDTPTTKYVVAVTDGTGLELRAEPKASATSLGNMKDNDEFDQCANPSSGTWHVVSYNGTIAWANTQPAYAQPKSS